MSIILALMLHPESQMKAQEQLDQVLGCNRLPKFGDLVDLPYVRACVLESFHWQPVVPLGQSRNRMDCQLLTHTISQQLHTVYPRMTNIKVFLFQREASSWEIHGERRQWTLRNSVLNLFRSMLHDKTVYPNPFKFTPERFLKSDRSYNHTIRDPQSAYFGFGRRWLYKHFDVIQRCWCIKFNNWSI